jgi:hypothetical protein
MTDLDETSSHKRKGSPSIPEENVEPKRARVESVTSDAPNGSLAEAADPGNAHIPEDEDRIDVQSRTDHTKPTESEHERPRSSGKQQDDEDMVEQQSPDGRRPSVSGVAARKDLSQEEKKRGKRLFGGLLSTLNQTASSTHQKKRLEIERRQREKAQQQKVEDDKHRSAKLASLQNFRKIDQVKFDEQVVRGYFVPDVQDHI